MSREDTINAILSIDKQVSNVEREIYALRRRKITLMNTLLKESCSRIEQIKGIIRESYMGVKEIIVEVNEGRDIYGVKICVTIKFYSTDDYKSILDSEDKFWDRFSEGVPVEERDYYLFTPWIGDEEDEGA